MERFYRAVDRVSATCRMRELQFFVVNINAYRAGALSMGRGNGAKPNSSTTENRDRIGRRDAPTGHGVKTNSQRLNQAQFLRRKSRGIQLLWRHDNVLGERTIPLHSKSLIELAGIRTPSSARRAFAAACVRRESHVRALRQTPSPA